MNILQLLHFNTNLKVPIIYRYTSILRMSLPSHENTHHPFPSTPRQHAKEILDVKDQVPRFQEELRCPVQLQWIEACGPLIFDSLSNDGLNMIRWWCSLLFYSDVFFCWWIFVGKGKGLGLWWIFCVGWFLCKTTLVFLVWVQFFMTWDSNSKSIQKYPKINDIWKTQMYHPQINLVLFRILKLDLLYTRFIPRKKPVTVIYKGVSKKQGYPKMDGLFHGNPY